ncbi:Uncharacterized metal-binding protein YceD, DUF177 family [Paracoccus homiensis]|uniref:Uncharacterized metal-binding protein YceD, DUF177 family n=1 Tax=Paracoccus homiensis TaxID=364199 RepID=A0A1H9YH08_9RHOB|nr:Uncharacterized metal-binding protein YceD, DUF177 family [Paracoccus homiensis]
MSASIPKPQRLRVAHLNPRVPTEFDLQPDDVTRAAITEELDLEGLPKLRFQGQLRADGADSWVLDGTLTAQVVQSCIITLKPVRSTIRETVARHYTPHLGEPEGEEVEMPDETLEPLGQFIDLSAVMIEELALALPEYPRASGAELPGSAVEDAPEADTRRPFADLDKLLKGGGEQ